MEVVTKVISAVFIFCFVRTSMYDSEFHLKKKYLCHSRFLEENGLSVKKVGSSSDSTIHF